MPNAHAVLLIPKNETDLHAGTLGGLYGVRPPMMAYAVYAERWFPAYPCLPTWKRALVLWVSGPFYSFIPDDPFIEERVRGCVESHPTLSFKTESVDVTAYPKDGWTTATPEQVVAALQHLAAEVERRDKAWTMVPWMQSVIARAQELLDDG